MAVYRANAKLNLTLGCTGKRADGYHLLDSVFCSVDLFDIVSVEKTGKGGITVVSDDPSLPDGKDNLAVRAAELTAERLGISDPCIEIRLEKHIPQKAGMGGGSADAAAAIAGVCGLYGAELSSDDMVKIGLGIGADVPFCLTGGLARVCGIGEKVIEHGTMPDCCFVILMQGGGNSTAEMFKKIDSSPELIVPDSKGLMRSAERGDIRGISEKLENVFTRYSDGAEEMCRDLLESGALGASLTGSGAAVFGIFQDEPSALGCADRMKKKYSGVYTAHPATAGLEKIGD